MWEATSFAPSLPSSSPLVTEGCLFISSVSQILPLLSIATTFALAQSLILSMWATSQLPSGAPGPLLCCGAVWLKQVSDQVVPLDKALSGSL